MISSWEAAFLGPVGGGRSWVQRQSGSLSTARAKRNQQLRAVAYLRLASCAAAAMAFGAGSLALRAFCRALEDTAVLVLCHRAEEGDKAAAWRRGQVEVGLVQYLDAGTAGSLTSSLPTWILFNFC